MNGNMDVTIKEARKKLGVSQEALADELGLSVQAVSKWECGLSCPDVALLPQLADYLGISLDQLLRGEERETGGVFTSLPDDKTLRIVQCVGRRVLSVDEWSKMGTRDEIPLNLAAADDSGKDGMREISLEVWGSAKISGDVGGDVNAGDSVACANINGDVSAGDNVACGNVGGGVNAGDDVMCGNVGGSVNAGDEVRCCSVSGSIMAGGGVTISQES